MGEYSKALSYYEKALEFCREVSPENHPDLANIYKSIAATYCNRREYSKALSSCKLSLDNFLRSPSAYHSHIQDVQKLIDRIEKL
jgi:tetratricopeptide (TPR) repeat protein